MREIKYNRKNMGLEIRYKRYVDRCERAVMISFSVVCAILVGVWLLGIKPSDLAVEIWTWTLAIAVAIFFTTGLYCSCRLNFEEYSNKYIKKRINKRYRKHKKWIL